MKIGLISDTHLAGSGWDLPIEVLEALRGVDQILHCGDLECLGVLDCLETIAPVLAVRGYEDPRERGDRLADSPRVVSIGALSIGMTHDIQWPGPPIYTSGDGGSLVYPKGPVKEIVARKFGQPVDVVAFGDTHQELVCHWDGVLMVNPGSPTYPGRPQRPGDLGTIAILEVNGEVPTARIVQLRRVA